MQKNKPELAVSKKRQNLNLTRRSFLQAAALGSAPFILPGRLWSAETAANEKLNLGFIGTGKQGRDLMGGFLRREQVKVVAVCDVDKTRRDDTKRRAEEFYAKQTGSTYKGCDTYNDFRELLARKDIDAVVIATPDHWHALIAIAAANAGKDIYCEKPLTQSIKEARALVNAVRKNQRVFQTGSMQRSSREFHRACELVRNGRLGKLEKVEVGVGGPPVPCDLPAEEQPKGLDWDMWLGPAPKRAYNSVLSPRGVHDHFPNWRLYKEYGGGMVTDWGAHHFDIAQWGLGMDDSGPVEIIPPEDKNATHGTKLVYANGIPVFHTNGGGVTFYGSEGKIFVTRGKFEATPESLAEAPTPEDGIRLYKSSDHFNDWLKCIRSREKPICDVEVGARTVSVCHLVNIAYLNDAHLKWDPAKEQFVGGTGNPKWLDIPHRDPWQLPS
ncbi:MAG: Gfo/Idh/MocA family protein [Limisphaerales bacterium]